MIIINIYYCNVGLLVSSYCYCIAAVNCLFTVKSVILS